MKIKQMFEKGTVFSFEIFPPKKTSSIDTIYNTLEQLRDLKPDFISVTFGAGGSSNNNTTCEIAQTIKEKYGIESAAHLPCINYTKEEIVKREVNEGHTGYFKYSRFKRGYKSRYSSEK